MPKYKFSWEHLPPWLLHALTVDHGVEAGEAAATLQQWYGARPTDLFVQECWEWLREDWLLRDDSARRSVVTQLRELGLGRHPGGTGKDVEMAYLRSCRNARRLREVVLEEFIRVGETDRASTDQRSPSSNAVAERVVGKEARRAGQAAPSDEATDDSGCVVDSQPGVVPTLLPKSLLHAKALDAHQAESERRPSLDAVLLPQALKPTSAAARRSLGMRRAVASVLAIGLAGGALMTFITQPDAPVAAPAAGANETTPSVVGNEPTSSAPTSSTPIIEPSPVPLVAGSYFGTFTVTRDEANVDKDGGRYSTLLGRHFQRTIEIDDSCDQTDRPCRLRYRSLTLNVPGFVTEQWKISQDGRKLTLHRSQVDDCVVPRTGRKVGSFDTTINATITFHNPQGAGSIRRWRTATVVYQEDAQSNDTRKGCYTSAYEAEGQVKRKP